MNGCYKFVKSKLKNRIYFSIIISALLNGCSNTKYVPVITFYEIKISKAIKGDRSTLFMDGSSNILVTQNKIRFRDKNFRLNRRLKVLQLNYFLRGGSVEFGTLGFNQIVDFPVRIPFGKDTIEIISADCNQISYKKLNDTNLSHLFIKDSISSNSSFRFDTLYPTKFNKNADTTIILTECRSKFVFKYILDLETYKLSETSPISTKCLLSNKLQQQKKNKSWRGNKIAPGYRQTTCPSHNAASKAPEYRALLPALRPLRAPLFAIVWQKSAFLALREQK